VHNQQSVGLPLGSSLIFDLCGGLEGCYARKHQLLTPSDPDFTPTQLGAGLTAVVSVKLDHPEFEGATRDRLGNALTWQQVARLPTTRSTPAGTPTSTGGKGTSTPPRSAVACRLCAAEKRIGARAGSEVAVHGRAAAVVSAGTC
jgi:hypothetical protein